MTFGHLDAARPEAHNDVLQRVPGGDLGLAPLVDEATGAGPFGRSRGTAPAPQLIQPLSVDRLERQAALKSSLGRGIELAGGLECTLTVEIGPVAAETDWLLANVGNRTGRAGRRLFQPFTAGGTESARPRRFELTSL
jgi:hypothetical protein